MVCLINVFFYERFAHSLFFDEQCEQIAQVAHQKWAMWANRSGRSPKISHHERFAQVPQQKWATMSESLRSLTKNEQMSEALVFLSESLIRSFFRKKRAMRLENRWANSQPCKIERNPLLNTFYLFELSYIKRHIIFASQQNQRVL